MFCTCPRHASCRILQMSFSGQATCPARRRPFAATLLELTRLQAAASRLRERYVSVTRTCSPPLPSPAPHKTVEIAALWAAQVCRLSSEMGRDHTRSDPHALCSATLPAR